GSRLNTATPVLLGPGRADPEAVGQTRRARQNHALVLADAADDLDFRQPQQADANLAAPGATAVEDVEVPPVSVARHRRPRDDQSPALLPSHDLDVDGGVGRQLSLRIRDLSEDLADFPSSRLPQS